MSPKTWSECVKIDVNKCGLAGVDTLDKVHGEPVFDIAWCCQPHRMGHGQHLNLRWIWMDGLDLMNNISVKNINVKYVFIYPCS